MGQHTEIRSAAGLALLAKVRACCGHLPGVEEKVDLFFHSSFRVNDKPFVMLGEQDEHSGPSISIKSDPFTQEILLQQEHFVKTKYIGHHGWVSWKRGTAFVWTEIEPLILAGYRKTAPKRLLNQLDK